ncbi:guanylin-like [Mantella aurantiaca]
MWSKLLCLLGLLYLADSVTVKVGHHTFSLKTLKEYKALADRGHMGANQPIHQTGEQRCQDKELPGELQELCQGQDTQEVLKTFTELDRICGSMDECEICANPACSGC